MAIHPIMAQLDRAIATSTVPRRMAGTGYVSVKISDGQHNTLIPRSGHVWLAYHAQTKKNP